MANFLTRVMNVFRRPNRVRPTETVGEPGINVYGGFLQNNEKNPALSHERKYETYSNILANTAIAAAGVRYFLNLTSKAKWTVEPANDTPRATALAETMEKILDDIETPWSRIVRRASMYRFYGFSVQEWTAKRSPQGIWLADIAPRAQQTIKQWDVDQHGKLFGVVQLSSNTAQYIYIPRSKIVYVVDDSLNDSPEGLGLFRHIVESSERLKKLEQLEAVGYENDLRGIPIARLPYAYLQNLQEQNRLTREQRLAIEQPIQKFITNHVKNPSLGLILDSMVYETKDEAGRPSNQRLFDIELLRADTGQTEGAIANAIERINGEIARILGVEGLLLGSRNEGSQALSRDKSHNFALIIDSTLTELAQSFDRDIIGTVWKLNGWPTELRPRFKPEATQFRDVTQITKALHDMARSGAMLDAEDPAVDQVRELLGLQFRPSMAPDLVEEPEENEDIEDDTDRRNEQLREPE